MRKTFFHGWVVISALFAVAGPVRLRADDKPIGFVLHVQGQWLINGRAVKQAGGSVPAGATIELAPKVDFSGGDTWQITIIRLDNQPFVLSCHSFDTCKKIQPAHAPASVTAAPPLLKRIQDAATHLLSLNPDRYVPAISRGANAPPKRLGDTVLSLNDGRIDLGDWLAGVEPGRYGVTFTYIGRDGSNKSPQLVPFDWGSGAATAVGAPLLQPGLYTARVVRVTAEGDQRISQDAWALISDAAGFARNVAAFREDIAAVRDLQSADPQAAQTFLRACLDDLAGRIRPQ